MRFTAEQRFLTVYRREIRHRNSQLTKQSFLGDTFLRRRQRLGRRKQWNERTEVSRSRERDVFELIGDDVDDRREGRECLLVVIVGHGLVRRDLEGGALRIGAVDVGLEAEAGGCEREHAAELAAAEDADGGAEGEGVSHLCVVSRRPWRSDRHDIW